ncbi:hypothetical protein M758_6G029600 [Ceratodon purpureus]|nr:hypothetical protein M758_6G029600 [Ceratodon purpureus]
MIWTWTCLVGLRSKPSILSLLLLEWDLESWKRKRDRRMGTADTWRFIFLDGTKLMNIQSRALHIVIQ